MMKYKYISKTISVTKLHLINILFFRNVRYTSCGSPDKDRRVLPTGSAESEEGLLQQENQAKGLVHVYLFITFIYILFLYIYCILLHPHETINRSLKC